MNMEDLEKAFEQWYNTEGWKAAGSGTYDDAKLIWMAACQWQGKAIAKSVIQGWQEAWFHPADLV